MRVCLRLLVALSLGCAAAAQPGASNAAANVLGTEWKQIAGKAGMIFAGEVLSAPVAATQRSPGAVPAVEFRIRVDEPIAGVERGAVLTIREWAPAYSGQRPLNQGQHVLLLLYPPSRLGLTSAVGGWMGQIALDGSGTAVANHELARRRALLANPAQSRNLKSLIVTQLASEIRAARKE